ncbi:serine/threonine-protein kinase Chk2-like [Oratosquilla oratoria]|uniref:serine/threonine-protein kinase Chk2-like n=1 Tax=Oratosquilla oratoria TaxID=337810 RepID=UPI003F75FB51
MTDSFPQSQASTQGLSETQEAVASPEKIGVWGRLLPLRGNIPSFDMMKDSYSFGRGCTDYRINEDCMPGKLLLAISKTHFIICREMMPSGPVVYVTDTSSNGTFINGERVGKGKKQVLQSNDEISLALPHKKVYVFHDLTKTENYPSLVTGKYTITKVLGKGAFGEVRLAFTKGSCERYAVKIMQKKHFTVKGRLCLNQIDQMQNEVKLLQSVHHPCVISIKDVIETEECIFIVMELADGGELFDRVVKMKQITESNTKLFFYQMVQAIKYLHSRNITHRDLKPENILLASDEDSTCIKIADFGLSKLLIEESLMHTFCGTLLYQAPELIAVQACRNPYTKAVDLWSLGIILFICLGGYPPFSDTEKGSAARQILEAKFSFHPKIFANVSDEAKDLITKLLVVDPKERYTIDQVLNHRWMQDDNIIQQANDIMNGCNSQSSCSVTSNEFSDAPTTPPNCPNFMFDNNTGIKRKNREELDTPYITGNLQKYIATEGRREMDQS